MKLIDYIERGGIIAVIVLILIFHFQIIVDINR